ADDERAEEVIVVMLDRGSEITFRVNVEKGRGQVGYELIDVLRLPTVFPLEVIDRVFPFAQQIKNDGIVGVDFVFVFALGTFPEVLMVKESRVPWHRRN